MKKNITLLILYFFTLAIYSTVVKEYSGVWFKQTSFHYFLGSFIFASIFFYKKMPSTSFYSSFRHELCHWLFSVLSLHKPHSIQINGDGSGHYQHWGKQNYFLVLAPYFFPIVAFFFLLFNIFFQKPAMVYYVLLGIALAFDLVSMFKDYHFQQTDWKTNGVYFSIQFSVLMLLLMLFLFCTLLFGNYLELWKILKLTFMNIKNIAIK